MFEALSSLLSIINTFTPLGIAALLGVVILLMVHEKGPIQKLANNHMAHVQASLERIADNSEKQLDKLDDISKDINYVKGRLNGKG